MITGLLVAAACALCFGAGLVVGSWVTGFGIQVMINEGKIIDNRKGQAKL
jgi:hypothetical protein